VSQSICRIQAVLQRHQNENKTRALEEANERIEMLEADIGKYISNAAIMTKVVEDLMMKLLPVVRCTLAAYRQFCDGTTMKTRREHLEKLTRELRC